MRVQITERHCNVPDEVLERTVAQMQSLLRYQPRAAAAEVVYTEEKLTRRIEVMIHVDGGEPILAHGEGDEFRTALDRVVERVRRRLRRQRQRKRDHHAPPLGERIDGE